MVAPVMVAVTTFDATNEASTTRPPVPSQVYLKFQHLIDYKSC